MRGHVGRSVAATRSHRRRAPAVRPAGGRTRRRAPVRQPTPFAESLTGKNRSTLYDAGGTTTGRWNDGVPDWIPLSGSSQPRSSGRAPPGSRKNCDYRYGPPPLSGPGNVPSARTDPNGSRRGGALPLFGRLRDGVRRRPGRPRIRARGRGCRRAARRPRPRRSAAVSPEPSAAIATALTSSSSVMFMTLHALRGAAVAVDALDGGALHHAARAR